MVTRLVLLLGTILVLAACQGVPITRTPQPQALPQLGSGNTFPTLTPGSRAANPAAAGGVTVIATGILPFASTTATTVASAPTTTGPGSVVSLSGLWSYHRRTVLHWSTGQGENQGTLEVATDASRVQGEPRYYSVVNSILPISGSQGSGVQGDRNDDENDDQNDGNKDDQNKKNDDKDKGDQDKDKGDQDEDKEDQDEQRNNDRGNAATRRVEFVTAGNRVWARTTASQDWQAINRSPLAYLQEQGLLPSDLRAILDESWLFYDGCPLQNELQDLSRWPLVGREQAGGREFEHYRRDLKDLRTGGPWAGLAQGQVDVWRDPQLKMVVRILVQAARQGQGAADQALSLDCAITAIDQPNVIVAPPSRGAPPVVTATPAAGNTSAPTRTLPASTAVPPAQATQAPAGGQPIIITRNGQTLTIDCEGRSVTVRSNGNKLTLRGSCSSVVILGNGNKITVESAVLPPLDDRGNGNKIDQQ